MISFFTDSDLAPALQAAANAVNRNLSSRNLNQKLYSRPDVDELLAVGVMRGMTVACYTEAVLNKRYSNHDHDSLFLSPYLYFLFAFYRR